MRARLALLGGLLLLAALAGIAWLLVEAARWQGWIA